MSPPEKRQPPQREIDEREDDARVESRYGQQVQIARSVAAQLDATGAEVIVTACPLCKKAIGRGTKSEVRDLAEIVVAAIK